VSRLQPDRDSQAEWPGAIRLSAGCPEQLTPGATVRRLGQPPALEQAGEWEELTVTFVLATTCPGLSPIPDKKQSPRRIF